MVIITNPSCIYYYCYCYYLIIILLLLLKARTRIKPSRPDPDGPTRTKKKPRECGALDLIYTGAVYLCCIKPTAARRFGWAHSLQTAQVISFIRCAGHIVTGKPPAFFLIGVRPTTTAIGKP